MWEGALLGHAVVLEAEGAPGGGAAATAASAAAAEGAATRMPKRVRREHRGSAAAAAARVAAPPPRAPPLRIPALQSERLLARLRALVTKIAKKKNMSAFHVMPIKVLAAVARLVPQTDEELSLVAGLGKKRSEAYGAKVCSSFISACRLCGPLFFCWLVLFCVASVCVCFVCSYYSLLALISKILAEVRRFVRSAGVAVSGAFPGSRAALRLAARPTVATRTVTKGFGTQCSTTFDVPFRVDVHIDANTSNFLYVGVVGASGCVSSGSGTGGGAQTAPAKALWDWTKWTKHLSTVPNSWAYAAGGTLESSAGHPAQLLDNAAASVAGGGAVASEGASAAVAKTRRVRERKRKRKRKRACPPLRSGDVLTFDCSAVGALIVIHNGVAIAVSFLLYTVTFYANLAHSLTRSP